jgi:hypothetical protein
LDCHHLHFTILLLFGAAVGICYFILQPLLSNLPSEINMGIKWVNTHMAVLMQWVALGGGIAGILGTLGFKMASSGEDKKPPEDDKSANQPGYQHYSNNSAPPPWSGPPGNPPPQWFPPQPSNAWDDPSNQPGYRRGHDEFWH